MLKNYDQFINENIYEVPFEIDEESLYYFEISGIDLNNYIRNLSGAFKLDNGFITINKNLFKIEGKNDNTKIKIEQKGNILDGINFHSSKFEINNIDFYDYLKMKYNKNEKKDLNLDNYRIYINSIPELTTISKLPKEKIEMFLKSKKSINKFNL